jgi:GTP-binding protein HflX
MDRLPGGGADAAALSQRLLGGGRHVASATAVSALTGAGIDGLLHAIDEALPLDPIMRVTLRIPSGDGATLALLHQFGRVLATRYEGTHVEVDAEVPESLRRRLEIPA